MTYIRRPAGRLCALLLAAALAGLTGCDLGELEPEGEPAPTDTGAYRSVPLEVVEQQGMTMAMVSVTIDGEGPYQFALDTGASATVVAADLAADLDLPTTGEERQIAGVIGADVVEIVEVDDWMIGDVALGTAEIAMIDMPSPQDSGGLQGLLGSDVLSNFGRIVVDYDRGRLELPPDELPPDEQQ